MTSTPGDRLKAARLAAGYTTAADLARAMGDGTGQNVRDHERGTRGITKDRAEAYSRILKIPAAEILYGPGHASDSGVSEANNVRMVGVIGEIRAGAFAAVPDDEPTPWEFVPVSLPQYSRATLFALQVVGRSMDKFYPDGTFVVVCPTAEVGVRAGDHAVIRVRKGGLVETTLKEVVADPDGISLWPRSTDSAYQTPTRLKTNRDGDDGPEIIGVVVASFGGRPRSDGPVLLL